MPRRSKPSLLRIGSALALVLVLAGCTKGGQFDPTEIFNNDSFDTKKKIKGDRELVFPNGVPGATTGVPADLVKGYQAPPEQSDANAGLPLAPPSKAEAAAKSKPKPKLAAAPGQRQDSVWSKKPAPAPTRISVGPAPSPTAPTSQVPSSQIPSSQAPWPAPPQTAPAQQSGQSSQSIWPNPSAPGKPSQ
jgi:hypothetical protein